MLITGHEDGCVCLWNVDSGAKIVAKGVLKEAVSSIASGTTYQSEILLATDVCGNIGVWNLSLFKRNPTVVRVYSLTSHIKCSYGHVCSWN